MSTRITWDHSATIGFLGLLLASLLLRVFIVAVSDPYLAPDTPGYTILAEQIAQGDLSKDNGARTPIYPVFIALLENDPSMIRLAQMAIGLAIVAILYWMTYKITRNILASVLIGSCYGLNLAQIQFESSVLSETLATFFLVLSLWLLCVLVMRSLSSKYSGWLWLAMGICAALAGLTRPLFVFLPLFLVVVSVGHSTKVAVKALSGILLPAILLIGGWSLFNYYRMGYFGPTTLTGYNLTNHSGAFIEYAPEGYATLRDIYLQARAEQVAETGTHSMTIWRVIGTMMEATGGSYAQVSQELTALSLNLFLRYPVLYGKSVLVSWIQFWNAPGWWYLEGAHNDWIARLWGLAWMIQKLVLVGINILFLILFTLGVVGGVLQKSFFHWPNEFVSFAGGLVAVTSLVQALLERGENTRYALPTQPVVAFFVIATLWGIVLQRRGTS